MIRQRSKSPVNPLEHFKGLVITEEEINCLLRTDIGQLTDENLTNHNDSENHPVVNSLNQLESQIQARRTASLWEGVYLSLPHLSQLFHLTPFEEQCLIICLATELDRKYEKLYAYLQDDIARKKPGVDLVLSLLCNTTEEKLRARLVFDPQATLRKYQLLQIIDNSSDGQTPLLSRFPKLNDRIVNFLLGFGQIDACLGSAVEIVTPQLEWDQVMVAEEIKSRMQRFISSYFSKKKPAQQNVIFYFYGPYGSGKRSLTEAVCHDFGISLIMSDMRKMLHGQLPFEEIVGVLYREAVLQSTALCLQNFDCLLADDEKHHFHLRSFLEMIQKFSGLTLFLLGNRPWKLQGLLNAHTWCEPVEPLFIDIELPIPGDKARKYIWESHLSRRYQLASDVDLGALASKFRFTPGQIRDALTALENHTHWRLHGNEQITMADLYAACRAQSDSKLNTLASKIEPKYTWDDIVLPDDALTQLWEICQRVSYRHHVMGEWGFGQKLSLGKGISALFAGSSGTGKTMAAEIIAHELGLDLYKIDLSQVVSKYIGETEKNLNSIFATAENANAVLFFDEADALFGRRSEVHDSHDRYANIEISYLLQKMEQYEGIAILATNLCQNLDEAFVRRLAFVVHFPFPDEANRKRIWTKIWPSEVPLAESVDLNLLAHRFKLSGGNIKNIALAASFLAAADGKVVKMEHLFHATQREYQKLGKTLSETELYGSYSRAIVTKE